MKTQRSKKKTVKVEGHSVTMDEADYNKLPNKRFFLTCGYCYIPLKVNGKHTTTSIHRFIMQTPKDMVTDHINGNKLDNRRENLRICNQQENARNADKKSRNTSGYKGVFFHKRDKRWFTQICLNGKMVWGGGFKTKEEAAKKYNELATVYFGDFARLNLIKNKWD